MYSRLAAALQLLPTARNEGERTYFFLLKIAIYKEEAYD